MLKRTLVFTNPVRLTTKNCQLVITSPYTGEQVATVPIEDIGMVLLENQMITFSMPLLNGLVDAGVAVVFCDEKHMPHAIVQNLDSNSLQGEMLHKQLAVGEVLRKQLWKQIVEAKIRNQSFLLEKFHQCGSILKPYYQNVKSGDTDNREGIAAHIYWQKLFGNIEFSRNPDLEGINSLLNYGYAILRAATARALISSGLTPSLGLFHHHRSNAFPLADDMMEPFRPFVDEAVVHLVDEGKIELTKETKAVLLGVLTCDTQFQTVMRPLMIGLSLSTASLGKCISGETKVLSLPQLF